MKSVRRVIYERTERWPYFHIVEQTSAYHRGYEVLVEGFPDHSVIRRAACLPYR